MDLMTVKDKFNRIGAKIHIRRTSELPRRRRPDRFAIDVTSTRKGEVFEVFLAETDIELNVVDVHPTDRHLLLIVKDPATSRIQAEAGGAHRRFLCGFDERHWFVAGVRRGGTVPAAKEALKPDVVREEQDRKRVKRRDVHRRENAAFVRQGEWFFVPAPDINPDPWFLLKREPLRRGRGKPHVVDLVYRRGGQNVRVCRQYPNGLTDREFAELIRSNPGKRGLPWQTMRRDPEVLVKGRVRHPDHKTVSLFGWHRAIPNEEVHTDNVAFLD